MTLNGEHVVIFTERDPHDAFGAGRGAARGALGAARAGARRFETVPSGTSRRRARPVVHAAEVDLQFGDFSPDKLVKLVFLTAGKADHPSGGVAQKGLLLG